MYDLPQVRRYQGKELVMFCKDTTGQEYFKFQNAFAALVCVDTLFDGETNDPVACGVNGCNRTSKT
jgi:hypothetical protein